MVSRKYHESITRIKNHLIIFIFFVTIFSCFNDRLETDIALGNALSTDTITFSPKYLQISDISLDVAVEPMRWEIVSAYGNLTTEWVLPVDSAGWHTNSAHAGAAGNVVLSGHHLHGERVFNALSLGWTEVGQQIMLTDESGQLFIYEIVEITEPILARRGTPAEKERSTSYIAPTEHAQLTLVTGWPSFSTTHRIFVIARLVQRLSA